MATTYNEASALAARARPSFFGLVGSGLLKLSRQWMVWIILALYLCGTTLLFFLLSSGDVVRDAVKNDQLSYLYGMLNYPTFVMRVFGGIFLIIITAYLVGLEYQGGTIRIILARGIGRVQLFLAQLVTALVVMLMLFIGWTIINIIGASITTLLLGGNLNIIGAANAEFWREAGMYMLTVLISMVATILMTAAMTVLGRSLAFGMSIGLAWFAADNIAALPLMLIASFLKSDTPLKLTGYLLGPVLNVLPQALSLKHIDVRAAFTPLVKVEQTQALLVVLIYAAVFLVGTLLLTWKKDIKE